MLTAPLVLATIGGTGCGGGDKKPAESPKPAADAAPVPRPVVDAAPPPVDAHGHAPTDGGPHDPWAPVVAAVEAGLEVGAAEASAPAACWTGFSPTGVPEADVAELGRRCAQGMAQLIPPVKHTFKQGESKSVPVAIVPGCYRVIAVGGKGVKDVDLALRDNAGKTVAADMTPDDVFPMIHPNREFCTEAVQFLNLTISVKKGAGEVAGGVWKR
jgi:hypothetical protein